MNTHQIVGNGSRHVLAVHGWFGSASGWGPWVNVLDREKFTFAFMDARGYGGMKGNAGPFTVEQMAADMVALADGLGWDKFDLIGHSMGGSVVQHVLLDAPERVGKIVAISPVPASGVPFDQAGWGLFSSAAGDINARKAILDLTTGNRLTGVWLQQMADASWARSDPAAVAAYLTAWAKTDFHDQVKGNPVSILLVVGQHDPALGEATMQQTCMQWYPNVQLEVMANAGHYSMDETPVALATCIERFLGA